MYLFSKFSTPEIPTLLPLLLPFISVFKNVDYHWTVPQVPASTLGLLLVSTSFAKPKLTEMIDNPWDQTFLVSGPYFPWFFKCFKCLLSKRVSEFSVLKFCHAFYLTFSISVLSIFLTRFQTEITKNINLSCSFLDHTIYCLYAAASSFPNKISSYEG